MFEVSRALLNASHHVKKIRINPKDTTHSNLSVHHFKLNLTLFQAFTPAPLWIPMLCKPSLCFFSCCLWCFQTTTRNISFNPGCFNKLCFSSFLKHSTFAHEAVLHVFTRHRRKTPRIFLCNFRSATILFFDILFTLFTGPSPIIAGGIKLWQISGEG